MTAPDAARSFLEKIRASIDAGTFVKLILSQPRSGDDGPRNVYARLIELRAGLRLSLVFRHATRDVTKNLVPDAALASIGDMLGARFERAHLFTTTGDWQLGCDAQGRGFVKASRPTFSVAPEPSHDRRKTQPLASGAPFLRILGVTNTAGEPRPGMAGKFRQIERFVEIIGHLVDDSPLRDQRKLRVLDMGCGKGYLTFGACDFFRTRGAAAEVEGIEMRSELVENANRAAREAGFERLRFERGAIADLPAEKSADLLIALHACDTATDDAIYHGIRTGAALIVTAPCCHKELRPQLDPPPVLAEVLKHGILREREAELVTDGIRALLLEIHGYKSAVFEFVSTEHTAKNLMIAGTRRERPLEPAPLRRRLAELLDWYGIREQRLARLLGEP